MSAATFARVPLWVWWIGVVLVVSFPLSPTLDPQWHRAYPVPFTDPADKPADTAANLLLFVPFGFSFARWGGRPLPMLLTAAATSAVAEVLQVFSRVRYPSGTDVTYAIAGTIAGGVAYAAFARLARP